jgi:hypothetical protein
VVGVLNIQHSPEQESSKPQDMPHLVEHIRKIGPGPYRSAVVCVKGTIYYSPVDSLTLARRLRTGNKWFGVLEEKNGTIVQKG